MFTIYIEDRLQSKIYLVVLFTILFSVNLFEFAYQIFILSADENIRLAYWLQFAKKYYYYYYYCIRVLSMIHVVGVVILSWCTFLKLEIKTIILY